MGEIHCWARELGRLHWVASLVALAFAAGPRSAHAADAADVDELEFHGFASQGFFFSVGNDYIVRESTKGSFEFTEVGLTVTKQLTETLQFGAQLIAQDLGPTGNLAPRVDWFYVDYRFRDWLGLRFGRLKLPYGLYNEIQDVDVARVPVLLPESVYPHQGRDILFAHTGVELSGFVRSPSLGALDYRAYVGTIFWDDATVVPIGTPIEIDFLVRYVTGGRVLWDTPLEGLRLGASAEVLRAKPTVYVQGLPAPIGLDNKSHLWLVSAEYAVRELVLTAEYGRGYTVQESDTPEVQPRLERADERMYLMANYRLTPWLQPGAYYSLLFPDVDNREPFPDGDDFDATARVQHDVALTLRFDINDHWLVKTEGHYMYGTAGLNNPLLVATVTDAEPRWATFFLKSTAYF